MKIAIGFVDNPKQVFPLLFDTFDASLCIAFTGKNANMQVRKSSSRYGAVSILMHWGVALTVFSLFGLGLWMVGL
ncbi:hypothetical protein R1N68_28575, partial [Klebsiella sp. 72742]